MKIKNSAKGFTLIELLVVVLIIGILSAIALPMYKKAVEKSRVADALTTMDAIAKSEHGWYLNNNSYTKDFGNLDIDLTDSNGNKADNASFANALYTYELLDTGIIAERNNGEYSLYKDYESQQILCTPGTHYICEDLGAFTKVPCEKVGMAWANTNSTCYVDNEARCKGLYDDGMWKESDGICGYKNTNGQEINEFMECRGNDYWGCQNSTINAGGVCVGSVYSCRASVVNNGGICQSKMNESCRYSTINAGGICYSTFPGNSGGGCRNVIINGGTCIGDCANSTINDGGRCEGGCGGATINDGGICASMFGYDGCQRSTINTGGRCLAGTGIACSYSDVNGGSCEGYCNQVQVHNGGVCSGRCERATVYDGGVCSGTCINAQINDGGICKSSATNNCNPSAYHHVTYTDTGCCCGDYCGDAPKCSAERCAALD